MGKSLTQARKPATDTIGIDLHKNSSQVRILTENKEPNSSVARKEIV